MPPIVEDVLSHSYWGSASIQAQDGYFFTCRECKNWLRHCSNSRSLVRCRGKHRWWVKTVIKDKAMCDVCCDKRHKTLRRTMTTKALQSKDQAAMNKKATAVLIGGIIEGTNERSSIKVVKKIILFLRSQSKTWQGVKPNFQKLVRSTDLKQPPHRQQDSSCQLGPPRPFICFWSPLAS